MPETVKQPESAVDVGSTRLLADISARTAHEIMAQIEFGVPTEELFALIVKNACLEVLVPANESAQAQPATGIRPANRGVYRLLPGALGSAKNRSYTPKSPACSRELAVAADLVTAPKNSDFAPFASSA